MTFDIQRTYAATTLYYKMEERSFTSARFCDKIILRVYQFGGSLARARSTFGYVSPVPLTE